MTKDVQEYGHESSFRHEWQYWIQEWPKVPKEVTVVLVWLGRKEQADVGKKIQSRVKCKNIKTEVAAKSNGASSSPS